MVPNNALYFSYSKTWADSRSCYLPSTKEKLYSCFLIEHNKMDIGILKTFIEVNRTRHFGKAAENLFLTQSAVSARIRLLEQTIGTELFTRSRNNIELTPTGHKLLKHAETILNTWNRARQEIATQDPDHISLAIGGVSSLWDILLQNWLDRLLEKHPNLSANAEVHNPDTLVRKLIDGALDLIFMFESAQMPEVRVEDVGQINLVLISSVKDISIEEALKNYVLVDWGTSFAITHAQHFPDMPPPKLRVHIGRLAYNHILKCGGSAYLAESMVSEELKNNKFHIVTEAPVIKRMAYAAFLPTSDKNELIQTAITELKQIT
jgi:DNA-binding transcriptional LysR family regulator